MNMQPFDPEHVTELYRAHAKELVVYSSGFVYDIETAREVVQDVFCKLYADAQRSKIKNISMRAFLYTAVRNRSISVIRSKKHIMRLDDDVQIASAENQAQSLVDTMAFESVQSYIEKNYDEQSVEVFTLRFVHALTYKEIQAVSGVSVSGISRILEKMISAIEREFPDML